MSRELENYRLDAWDEKPGHTPLKMFDDHLPDCQSSLEVRTEEFEKTLFTLSRGSGLMENDIEYLADIYEIPLPYEELGE